jgi:hypothetical protein
MRAREREIEPPPPLYLSQTHKNTHIRTQDHEVREIEDRYREKTKREILKTQEIRKGDARQR